MLRLDINIKGWEKDDLIAELEHIVRSIKGGAEVDILARGRACHWFKIGEAYGGTTDCDDPSLQKLWKETEA